MPAHDRYDHHHPFDAFTPPRHAVATALVAALALAGCSVDDTGGPIGRHDSGAFDAAVDGGPAVDGATADIPAPVHCDDGRASCGGMCCAAGTDCAGGYCCATADLCGEVCCAPGSRCEGGACVLNCGTRARCGDAMPRCCDDGQVCYVGACTTPGAACSTTTPCPDGQYCEPTLGHCLPRAMGSTTCAYRPPVGTFHPTLRWQWTTDSTVVPGSDQVMTAPVVANLTDDNHDGRIDHNDVPDVMFTTFSGTTWTTNGVVRAVSGDDGHVLWPMVDPGFRVVPGASLAVAELDASSPGPEIVACWAVDSSSPYGATGEVLVLSARGTILRNIDGLPCSNSAPAIGDMDGDGSPEIAVGIGITHADGTVPAGFGSVTLPPNSPYQESFSTLADVDNDGRLELVTGTRAIRIDGSTVWTRDDLRYGYPAVADIDGDGHPEVVVVQVLSQQVTVLDGATGHTAWGPVALPTAAGPTNGGGPPTIADFDGDGTPDIGVAASAHYAVISGRTHALLWSVPTHEHSGGTTGSSVFDFDGDGRAEVVFGDEQEVRVLRGTDGISLFTTCNTSGTLWEYPVVADVDNDGHADMVVVSSTAFPCLDGSPAVHGVRVFSDALGNWVRTRSIWNEHTYHVTNVDLDAHVPASEPHNWSTHGLNDFRQNVQVDGVFDAPDLVATDLDADTTGCPTQMTLHVRVVNEGSGGAPAGVPVTFWQGTTRVGRATTTRPLLPGESEVVAVVFTVPASMAMAMFTFTATVNDPMDMPLTTLHECSTTNDTTAPLTLACRAPG